MLIRSLPPHPPVASAAPPEQWLSGPSALVRGLLANRNIRPGIPELIRKIGDGPYVAGPTMARVLHNDSALTPHYVSAFAAVLGYEADDLIALTGVGRLDEPVERHPRWRQIAALGWDARRLDSGQLNQIHDAARGLWVASRRREVTPPRKRPEVAQAAAQPEGVIRRHRELLKPKPRDRRTLRKWRILMSIPMRSPSGPPETPPG